MDATLEERWRCRHGNGRFIWDGIIHKERWGEAPRKVLFLLKEAYAGEAWPDGFDLPCYVREHANDNAVKNPT